jgi:hypothetical protein
MRARTDSERYLGIQHSDEPIGRDSGLAAEREDHIELVGDVVTKQ